MKIKIKISQSLYDKIDKDLDRMHEHAAERLGFALSSYKELTDSNAIIIISAYEPIPDDDYLEDLSAGARISGRSIRNHMQRIMDGGRGGFHVHRHEHNGIPRLSFTDEDEIPEIVRSFQNANPNEAHGILLLSKDKMNAWVWLPNTNEPVQAEILVVVGYPMSFSYPKMTKSKPEERFKRQIFLGKESEGIFSQIVVGVIGLGGGGSHIAQQLAHVGVQNPVLLDDDKTDTGNLNRMVGAGFQDAKDQIAKVEVAKRLFLKVLPHAQPKAEKKLWQEHPELLQTCDIVIGCVDSFAARRDLEAECRRYLIPYIDIGMDIHEDEESINPPSMVGQVILSMPGRACMKCLGFLSEINLAKEAAKYGNVGGRPQVIWPNGILASLAIGTMVDMCTNWSRKINKTVYLSLDGNQGTVGHHPRGTYNGEIDCLHYPQSQIGTPQYKKFKTQ